MSLDLKLSTHHEPGVINIFPILGGSNNANIWFRSTPHPVTVTTRIITFLVGNPYKPSFATVTGWGVDPIYGNFEGVIGFLDWRMIMFIVRFASDIWFTSLKTNE